MHSPRVSRGWLGLVVLLSATLVACSIDWHLARQAEADGAALLANDGGTAGGAGTRCTSANAVFHSSGDQTQCNSSGQGDPNGQHNFSNTWDVYDNMWNCTAN